MTEYPTERSDRRVEPDRDLAFAGVNERLDAGVLPGGNAAAEVTAAVNVRFVNGSVETRGGYVQPVPLNAQAFAGAVTADAFPGFSGAGLWTDAAGTEFLVYGRRSVLDEGEPNMNIHAYIVREGRLPRMVQTEEATETPPQRTVFVQCGPELVMFRDTGEPWHWSGDFNDGWQTATLADVPTETVDALQPLPATAAFGCEVEGRVVFPYGEGIGWTDILEPRRWDAALDWAELGKVRGRGLVTGLAPWRRGVLAIFKETSVWALTGFTGDLADLVLEQVSDQAGCIASRTVTSVGGDILWLGRGAVYRITEVLDNSRQLSPIPVSWDIPRTMGRINWNAADNACAVLADGLWYLAVPVDGSLVNNALLIYDTRTAKWQGEDTFAGWDLTPDIRALARTTVFGVESVIIFMDQYNVLAGPHGWHDGIGEGDIPSRVELRGYALPDRAVIDRFVAETEELGTADVAMSAYLDGRRTAIPLCGAMDRDPEKYIAWGKADRDLTNAGNDAAEPDRDDYAWVLGGCQTETATVVATITTAGNATVTVTAAGLTGSPLATSVAVALGDDATQVARKIRTALAGVAAITARFDILGNGGPGVILHRKVRAANDATLNIAIAAGTSVGITPAATSANTTTGSATREHCASMGAAGIPLGYLQRHTLKGAVIGRARWVKPIITSARGRLRLNSIAAMPAG